MPVIIYRCRIKNGIEMLPRSRVIFYFCFVTLNQFRAIPESIPKKDYMESEDRRIYEGI